MAHNCIYCGCDCFCNGDIDDCNFGDDLNCTGCGSDLDDQHEDDGYDDDDMDWPPDDYFHSDDPPIQTKN